MDNKFWNMFDSLVVFDVETTGLNPKVDHITELSAVCVRQEDSGVVEQFTGYVKLPEGVHLDPKVSELTGITEEKLAAEGSDIVVVLERFFDFFKGSTLVVAHNAAFDLSFVRETCLRQGREDLLEIIDGADYLDTLTVAKDRVVPPHKLGNLMELFGVTVTGNLHDAAVDVLGCLGVLYKLAEQKDDIMKYVDVFGYFPWASHPQLNGVTFIPQGKTGNDIPLYELVGIDGTEVSGTDA